MNLALDALAIGALRRATAARHQHLESFLRLGDPLQLGGYIDALRGFEIFLSSWEPRLRVATPARLHAWLASRSRYGFACQDLTHFNAGPRPGLSDVAACASLVDDIALNSTAAAFGSLYVLEGSALGVRSSPNRRPERLAWQRTTARPTSTAFVRKLRPVGGSFNSYWRPKWERVTRPAARLAALRNKPSMR